MLVTALMDARRPVKQALGVDDVEALTLARSRVADAKVALGERGPKWWEDGNVDDVTLRLECGRRALQTVGADVESLDDLRSRFGL